MTTNHRRLVWALSVLLAIAAWLAQPADVRADTGNDEIDKGVALYNDLEYEQSIATLSAALKQPSLSKEEKTVGYQHLALAHLAGGRDDDAKQAFRSLLEADRGFKLPITMSQKARDLFDEVKRSLPPPKKPPTKLVRPVTLQQVARPAEPKPGAAITIDVRSTDPDKRIARVVVHYRVRGQRSYSAVVAKGAGTGAASVIISGAFVKGPALEYYVVAEDGKGKTVSTAGDVGTPIVLVVGAVSTKAAPIYTKWWFWTGTGVAVASVLAGVLLLSGDSGTPATDATVVVTVEPPM